MLERTLCLCKMTCSIQSLGTIKNLFELFELLYNQSRTIDFFIKKNYGNSKDYNIKNINNNEAN